MNAKKIKRRLLRTLVGLGIFLLLYLGGLIAYGTINDYQPPDRLDLQPAQPAATAQMTDSILTFTIWNLGFGGLGRESDFFYDDGHFFFSGGRQTRTPLPLVEKNVAGMLQLTDTLDSDFFLFQEVDIASRRSHHIDQFAQIAENLPGYSAVFAANFHVPYVPIPVFEPWHAYGKAYSGLASYARYAPAENVRLQLPGDFSWPNSVFSLDRCLLLQRYPLEGDRQLVVVNLHHSAYDREGVAKKRQMSFLKTLLLEEYGKGHYVVAGGDWNLCPPYFRFDGFMPGRTQGYTQLNIEHDLFPPDWLWIYDATYPSNRKTRSTYVPGTTFVTLIDFFLVSPNVKVRRVKTIHQDFEYSDHQPVWMEVELLR